MKNLIIITILCMSFLITGCPISPKDIASVKSHSKNVATYADAGVEITRTLYRAGRLPLADKDEIADGFTALAQGGGAFDAVVAAVERQYANNVPKSELKRLFGVFSQEIVAKLIPLLRKLKVPIPGIGSATFGQKIELIISAILAVAAIFGQRDAVAAQIAGA